MFKNTAIITIDFYQRYIRRALPCCCRFTPSCSEYAKQAVAKYGLFKGGLLAMKRLFKCHPFSQAPADDPLV